MDWYSIFYWITVADGVKSVFDTFSNIFTFLTVASLIAYAIIIGITIDNKIENKNEEYIDSVRWGKFAGRFYWFCQIICIVTWLGYVFTPTKKDCLMIVAGGVVGNFITTDSASKEIPSDITKFLHLSLNKEIEELSNETKQDIKKELGIESPKDKLIENVKYLTKEQIIEYLKNDTTLLEN